MTTSPARTPGRPPAPEREDGPDILCDNLVRIFSSEGVEVVALQGLDLEVDRGELIALVGASGSGKSTLLNILSGLDLPSAGVARVAGRDLLTMSTKDRLHYRRHTVGFLFQQATANLLPYLSAVENVQLPMMFASLSSSRAQDQGGGDASSVLGVAGVRATGRLGELSGGQQQRVALGVALANRPRVLLADEPTGELDSAAATRSSRPSAAANESFGTTVVVVTHDPSVSEHVSRTIGLRDGRTSSGGAAADLPSTSTTQGDRGGVRRARPGRPAPAAPRVHRHPRDARPGAARPRGRPHRVCGPTGRRPRCRRRRRRSR